MTTYPKLNNIIRLVALECRVVGVLEQELSVLDVAKSAGLAWMEPVVVVGWSGDWEPQESASGRAKW